MTSKWSPTTSWHINIIVPRLDVCNSCSQPDNTTFRLCDYHDGFLDALYTMRHMSVQNWQRILLEDEHHEGVIEGVWRV